MPKRKKDIIETEPEYYNIENLITKYPGCEFYFPFGEKSSGKTYSINLHCLREYFKNGACFCYIRRTDIDIKSPAVRSMFNGIAANELKNLSNGKYTGIVYYRSAWYLVNRKGEKDKNPFCYAFAINATQHTNGSAFPMIKNIFVDEVITRDAYLPSEIEKLETLMSNIYRERGDLTIFMAGNTWNKYSPYFKYFGFDPTKVQEGETRLLKVDNAQGGTSKVAIERTRPAPQGKASDKYFLTAEKSKTVSMITKGAWVCDEYPGSQSKWGKENIVQRFFIIFDGQYVASEIVNKNGNLFLFFHPKKDKFIKHPDRDLVFCDFPDYHFNYYDSITRPTDDITKLINVLFQRGKAFYSDDDTGEILRNYILYSTNKVGVKKMSL